MTTNQNLPKTLLEATQYFSDNRRCVDFIRNLRWPDGEVCCLKCGSLKVKELRTRQIWKCYDCKKQFSIKVGTIFEDSALPLSKWLTATWLVMNAKNGISSYEISRAIGVAQKNAWHMGHRIREAMRTGSIEKFTTEVEADSSFIGGEEKNRHVSVRTFDRSGKVDDKTEIFAIVERGGNVTAKVIDKGHAPAQREIRKHVAKSAKLFTDEHRAFKPLGKEYRHETVNHSQREYVHGNAYTNTVEGFFGLFKRCYKGTYIHMAPFHIDRYLDEQCLRYNYRKQNDGERFQQVASQIFGKKLTWNELTAKSAD